MVAAKPIAAGVVVPIEGDPDADHGRELGAWLGSKLGLAVRMIHIDVDVAVGDLAEAIVARIPPSSLVAMHSEHVNRWGGKSSTAEHVIDQWAGLSVVAGPRVTSIGGTEGPILVALDGSPNAERALEAVDSLAVALGCGIVLARVVPEPLGGSPDEATAEANAYLCSVVDQRGYDHAGAAHVRVLSSNDPIASLCSEAERLQSQLIVLASRGDRSTERSSLSRTCSGLIGEAVGPVVIVGTEW